MACALASAFVVPDAGADPEIAPDPGSIPSAVSPETPVDESTERRALKLDYSVMPTALRIVLPPPSAEEKHSAAETDSKPRVMIGYHRDMPSEFKGDLSPQFDWIEQSDESYVTSLSVTSPGAESLRVGIRAELGPDGEIRFFGEQSDERFPVITREDFPIEGDQIKTLWSPTIDGDTIGIEITLPSKKAMSVFWLTVDAVAHTFVPTHSFPSAPKLDCPSLHIDVACRSASIHGDLQNAVAHIRFEDIDSYICAGTLMNDTVPSTVVPYFLTANHCVGTGTVARTVEAWWFYQNARCGISALDSRYTRTSSGTDLLTTSSSYDQSLLRFRGSIPGGLTFSGSNPSSLNHPTGVYGIHHPDGVVKSYSVGNTVGNRSSDGVLNALHVRWSEGTESGSSGSVSLVSPHGGQLVERGDAFARPAGRCARACFSAMAANWSGRFRTARGAAIERIAALGGGGGRRPTVTGPSAVFSPKSDAGSTLTMHGPSPATTITATPSPRQPRWELPHPPPATWSDTATGTTFASSWLRGGH